MERRLELSRIKGQLLFAGLILSLLFGGTAKAQDRPGIENSNYAGTNGISLNPSSMVDSRLFLDIHFVGVNAQFNNNYVYLPNSRIYDLFNGVQVDELAYKTNNAKKHGFAEATVMGPSAMLSLGRNGFGVSTSVRSYTHVNNIPDELADLMIEGYIPSEFVGQHDLKNVSAKQLTWGELGFSYARMLKADQTSMISGGLTVKRLYGINSSNASLKDFSMTVTEDNVAIPHNFSGEYAYVTPAWTAGKGWGLDLGFTYKRALNGQSYEGYTPHVGSYRCEPLDYQYKLGVSILDIGSIKMENEAVVRQYETNFDEEDNLDAIALPDSEDPVEFAEAIFTDENATGFGNSFRAQLPMAASVQFDYNFGNNFYLNGTAIQRFNRMKMNGVHRSNRIAVTPRYETKHFEASLPLTLLEYRHPMVGAMIRYRAIIVGTDNLTPWLFRSNLYRGDVYFHLKLPIASRSGCKEKTPKQRAAKPGKSNMFGGGRNKNKKPGKKYFKSKKGNCPGVVD